MSSARVNTRASELFQLFIYLFQLFTLPFRLFTPPRSRGYLSVRWSLEQEKPYTLSTKYKFDYVDFQFTTLTGFTLSALR